jgi:hypothetical protein
VLCAAPLLAQLLVRLWRAVGGRWSLSRLLLRACRIPTPPLVGGGAAGGDP